jgi:hypothetical protein
MLLRMSSSQDDTRTPQEEAMLLRMSGSQDDKWMHHRMWLLGSLHGLKKVAGKDCLLRRMLKRMSRWIGKGLQG